MTAWEGLDHEVPLLLVPVRLETQTEAMPADAPPDAPVRLRVRIYPDDVGLDHDTGTALLLPDAFVVVARVGGDVVARRRVNPSRSTTSASDAPRAPHRNTSTTSPRHCGRWPGTTPPRVRRRSAPRVPRRPAPSGCGRTRRPSRWGWQ